MSKQSISNFSRKLLTLFWFSIVFSVVLNTVFWFSATMFNAEWFNASFPIEVSLPLSTGRSLIGYFPSMISTLLTVALLWQLIVLFRLYEKGIIFELQNSECFKKLSYLLIATPFVELLMDVLLSLALSFNDGNWNMSFTIDDSDITMMIIGFIVRVIAVVMEKAAVLQEESELTI
ncbi:MULTISPECIES: DUF2975 domain-containing protein [Vibrio]|jgi:hypothetical protein|uniref:DUF2975 domain-containing protein n=1 Tax=Vibrio kanaloae TaxID=170673 RepID=A0A2N7JC12_9VIBR|nr:MULTISPECIES: DUF2975 domain-containing protein [Vibrio]MCG9559316.1 DUF2975 domain-containing protein [Vibrio kanaloae]NOI01541.1 DUF2975 domain-containing protein [Vibrio kanaloae]NOJ00160.1 DUF2975 domain-containing protein [Vibrio kanaloae]OEF15088.1 hypothetical protein A132_14480 [Vibrio kanaloae 5S-149]PMM04527.1 hypothetical protein BCT63_12405 [Vibrio kanaloae]